MSLCPKARPSYETGCPGAQGGLLLVCPERWQSLLGQNLPLANIAEAEGGLPRRGRSTRLQVEDLVARDTKYQTGGREAIDGFLSKGQLRALHLFNNIHPVLECHSFLQAQR